MLIQLYLFHLTLLQRPGPADLPYTTLGRLGPSCQSKPHNSLSKLLFSPDWTIVMLSWRVFPHVLSSLCNWSRMQQPERSLMSRKMLTLPLYSRLHWLPIAARIRFKVLKFAYKTTTGAAPIYLNLLVQTYAPSRSLRSASERRLVVPSQRGTNHSHGPFPGLCSAEWPPDLNSNSWVFSHFQKKHLKTSFSSPAPD